MLCSNKYGACVLLACLLFLSACSTTSLSFDSAPEKATVTVKPLGGGATKVLGQTPLTIRSSEIEPEFRGSGPLVVEFSKEGYKPRSVFVTELSAMNLNLKVDLDGLSGLDDPAELNAQIESIFEAQRLVRVRRFDQAMKIITQIKSKVPTLSAPHELEGGMYYMAGRHKEALDAYRNAVKLNPRSVEAVRMRDLLERQLGASGVRAPASRAPAAAAPSAAGGQ